MSSRVWARRLSVAVVALGALPVLVVAGGPPAMATRARTDVPPPTPIEFEPGSSSTSIEVTFSPGVSTQRFSLRASAAQEMTVAMLSGAPDDLDPFSPYVASTFTFSLLDPAGEPLASGGSHGTRWLPLDGDYILAVTSTGIASAVDVDISIVDGPAGEPSRTAPPTWATRMTARPVGSYDVTVSVPEFADEALNRAVDERAAALVDAVVSQEWGGYVDVRTDVLLAGPTLVALSFRADAYNEGGAHPYAYFDAMLWDPVAGGPLALGDVLDIALTADGQWRGPWAETLAAGVRSVLDSLSVPVEEIFDEASLRSGLITPGLDGVVVAYGQCMVVPCAVGAMRLVLSYDSFPGLATMALEQALSGPTASGD